MTGVKRRRINLEWLVSGEVKSARDKRGWIFRVEWSKRGWIFRVEWSKIMYILEDRQKRGLRIFRILVF